VTEAMYESAGTIDYGEAMLVLAERGEFPRATTLIHAGM
jgi:hypothetical protein